MKSVLSDLSECPIRNSALYLKIGFELLQFMMIIRYFRLLFTNFRSISFDDTVLLCQLSLSYWWWVLDIPKTSRLPAPKWSSLTKFSRPPALACQLREIKGCLTPNLVKILITYSVQGMTITLEMYVIVLKILARAT